jgi:hypothetical protein
MGVEKQSFLLILDTKEYFLRSAPKKVGPKKPFLWRLKHFLAG